MILLFCLITMLDGGGAPAVFQDTELYKPLRAGDVAVTPEGHVFVIDFDQGRLLHYDASGKRLADVGRKGKGPGEFQNPGRVWYEDGQIFVHDPGMGAVSIFKADGTFVDRATFQSVPRMTKIPGGWLMANLFRPDDNGNVTVYQTDNMLKNKTAVTSFPKSANGGDIRVEMDGSSVPKVPFNPVSDDYHLAGGPQSSFAYICHPGNVRIDVIDTRTKKVVDVIKRDMKSIPFNKEWGMTRLEESKARTKKMGGGFEFVPDFPETFPFIRSARLNQSGDLVLSLWTGLPDKQNRSMVLNRSGKDASLPYAPENDHRVMAVLGDTVYVSTYGAEADEAGMVTCSLKDVDATAKAHEIAFEGSSDRLIMRMN